MNRLIGMLTACLLFVSCAAVSAFAAEEEAFVPVLRFIASSDSHVRTDGDATFLRIGDMLKQAYALSDRDKNYSELDALVMAGDLTHNGTAEEFDRFWTAVASSKRDETQFLGVVAKNHDGWNMSRKELRSYYSALTGEDPDFHKIINGFHFIGLSASDTDGVHYSKEQLAWLKAQLDAAVADSPDRPVFFIHHEHNRYTVYGSSSFDGWGIKYFRRILKNYPQVVDFSGHSHYPLNDPRSVWQGSYTAIGTGAIYYAEFTIDDIRAYDPPDCEQTATYWLAEVNAAGDLHLRGMDILAGKQLCEYIIKNPADRSNRAFTPKKQKAASLAPAFSADAVLAAESTEPGRVTLTVPAAQPTDGQPVVLYRLTAKNALGITVDKQWNLPPYHRAEEQDTITFELDGLAKGTYTFRVVAETAYGVRSEPVEGKLVLDEGANGFRFFLRTLLRPFRRFGEVVWHRVLDR